MPLVPNLLERLVLLRLNRGPGPMLDLVGAGGTRAVAVALDEGIFETLGESSEPHSAATLATRLGLDQAALGALLDFLDTLGYVTTTGEGYELTAMSRRWLTDDEETNFGPWLRMWDELIFPFWDAQLGQTLRTGEPSQTVYEWFDEQPGRWRTAQEGFRAVGQFAASELVDSISLPDGASTLLDVGGGHGYYSVAFCREYPTLSATVLDVPETEPVVAETVADADMADRITFHGGDYTNPADIGHNYDVALLCNVIHAHDGSETQTLFERVADALDTGGMVIVLDQFAGTARTRAMKAAVQFIRLNYVTTLGGTVHPLPDVREWLADAGFKDVQRKSAGPGTSALVGTKSA